MGQAKLRGSKQERVNQAVAAEQERLRKREEREMEIEAEKAERWRQMSPEEKEAALEQAKAEAGLMGIFSGLLGAGGLRMGSRRRR